MKKLIAFILIIGFGPFAYADGDGGWKPLTGEADYERDFDQTYSITPEAAVGITHTMGDLTVAAWDRKEVRVQARMEVKGDKSEEFGEKIRIEVEEGEKSLEISTRYPEGDWKDISFAVALEVHLPAGHPLTARCSLGGVSIKGMHRPVTLKTASGDLAVHDVKGKIDLTASLGKVIVKNCEGEVNVTANNSNMEIEDVRGNLVIHNALGDVKIASVDGSIKVTSANGNIKASGISYLNKRTGKGNRIDIISSIGRIDVALPDPPSFQLMAAAAFGSIESDFNLSNVIKGHNSEVCFKKFGDAKATIDLKSTNGNIRIAKEKNSKRL